VSEKHRVEKLAARLVEANDAAIVVAERCTQEQWETIVPVEDRTVGALFHHLAYPVRIVMGWVMTAASGEPLPTDITPEVGDDFNERHMQKYGSPSKEETIEFLKESCKDAAEKIRSLTDNQLDIEIQFTQPYREAAPFLIGGKYATPQLLVEWNLIYHRYDHLAQIKTVLGID
jgi:hypothetical protein